MVDVKGVKEPLESLTLQEVVLGVLWEWASSENVLACKLQMAYWGFQFLLLECLFTWNGIVAFDELQEKQKTTSEKKSCFAKYACVKRNFWWREGGLVGRY